jgi:hypothetical protein
MQAALVLLRLLNLVPPTTGTTCAAPRCQQMPPSWPSWLPPPQQSTCTACHCGSVPVREAQEAKCSNSVQHGHIPMHSPGEAGDDLPST